MMPPDKRLAEGMAFTALMSEVAADPATMTEVDRLNALDHLIANLVMVVDASLRELYLELAVTTLKIGKRTAKSRLANALHVYRIQIEDEAKRQAEAARAAAPPVPPMVRFQQALAAAVPGFTFLLSAIAPTPALLDDVARLKAADQVIAAIAPMPDTMLRDLYLDKCADHLELKPRDLRLRFKLAQDAPSTPAGQAVGGEIRDGGFHIAVVAALGRFIDGLQLRPDAVSGWLDADGRPASVKQRNLVNAFFFTHASFFDSLPRDRIDITLSAMTEERRQRRRAEILATVTGKPATQAGADELRKFLIALTHRDDPVDFAVMRHWMWQVKRLNTKRTVAWDLMPIMVGKQGDGKSTAIQILCRPWGELMIGIKAETLTDERSTEVLGDYAIGFWGEMSGGNKAEVTRLKQTLTSVIANYRELGGHNHNSVVRRMAFIGDSNNPVREVIVDSTGARRFYEIKVPTRTDHAALNALDPALIWQAVSEDEAPPFDAVAADVQERQRTLVHQDSFDFFIEWCDSEDWAALTVRIDDLPVAQNGGAPTYTVRAYSPERGYKLIELLILFRHYARLAGVPPKGDNWLARRLSESGWEKHRPRAGSDPTRPWYYRKPSKPTDPIAAPAGPTRGEKIAAEPSPAEDLFAASQRILQAAADVAAGDEAAADVAVANPSPDEAPLRQPGDDEDVHWPPSYDDAPHDDGGGDGLRL